MAGLYCVFGGGFRAYKDHVHPLVPVQPCILRLGRSKLIFPKLSFALKPPTVAAAQLERGVHHVYWSSKAKEPVGGHGAAVLSIKQAGVQ
ncbi:hypothetical protein ACFQPG_01295 [Sphingomonas sp. GCM10030256]|uniref:hypothetical protein n=1 Tax=Sphingomonas sp. GCM10030256 TaxID=3273427 RepID=UPI00361280F8